MIEHNNVSWYLCCLTDLFFLFAIIFVEKLTWEDLTQVIAQPATPAG